MDASCWLLLGGVIVAAIGLFVAYRQLRHVSQQLSLLRKSSKANVLFELDRKYEDIFSGRKAARELADEIKERVVAENSEREYKFLEDLTNELEKIREKDSNKYFNIKQVFDFCEVIGYFTICEYIDREDVDGMWGPAIKTWGYWFKEHIVRRQKQEGEDVYKYFILLSEKLQQENKKQST
jgi:hypothetical protein